MSKETEALEVILGLMPNAKFIDKNGKDVTEDVKKSHNKQTLTELWKKGELENGEYFVLTNLGVEKIEYIKEHNGFGFDEIEWVEEVLAPVPSYEEWQQMKAFCEEFNALNVAEENKKLKDLLKEWMHFYPIILYEHEDTLKTKDIVELYDKTREVLK